MDKLINSIKELNNIWHYEYLRLAPIVNNIINDKITDDSYVERIYDLLLDLPTFEGKKLLIKLSDYYKNINPQAVDFYLEEYKYLYHDDYEKEEEYIK